MGSVFSNDESVRESVIHKRQERVRHCLGRLPHCEEKKAGEVVQVVDSAVYVQKIFFAAEETRQVETRSAACMAAERMWRTEFRRGQTSTEWDENWSMIFESISASGCA